MTEKLEFENKEIDIQELPTLEDLQFNKVENKYLFVLLLRIIMFSLVFNGIGFSLYFFGTMGFPSGGIIYSLLGINILFILRLLMTVMTFKIRAYAIRERDISYQRGLIVFKQTTVSVNRIQHVELTQSLLMKLFNLSSIKIYTAGGNQSDISIAGINKEKAEEIKSLLSKKVSQHE